MQLRCCYTTVAGIILVALLAACGGGGGGMMPSPQSTQNSGSFTVSGFAAKFTEYPLPPGTTPVDLTIGADGAAWFGVAIRSPVAAGRITTGGTITLFPMPKTSPPPPFTPVQLLSGSGVIAGDAGAIFATAIDPSGMDEALLTRVTLGGKASTIGGFGICCDSPFAKMIVGPDGDLWTAACDESCGSFGGFVVRSTPAGTQGPSTPLLPSPGPPTTYSANGLAAGPDRNLYATSNFTGVPNTPGAIDSPVFQISLQAKILHVFRLPDGSFAHGIVTGPDHNLWIAETGTNKIARMTTAGVVTEFTIPLPNAGPQMIAAGSDGALWFTEKTGNALGRITTNGTITEFPIPTPNAGAFGIVSCPVKCENAHGRIWLTEMNAQKIAKFEF